MTISNVSRIRIMWLISIIVLGLFLSTPAFAQQPLAKIKAIFVDDVAKDSAGSNEVEIFRSNSSIPVTKSMLLMKGDRVVTHFNARVILLYLLDAVETDKEMFVRTNDETIIGGEISIFQKVGEILLGLKGLFAVETQDTIFAASGTEFAVQVTDDVSNLVVFSGYVNVQFKNVSLLNGGPTNLLQVSYSPPDPGYESVSGVEGLQFQVFGGTKTNIKRKIRLSNDCQKRHKFEIRAPDNMKQIDISDDDATVNPGDEQIIESTFEINGKELRTGVYTNYFTVYCENCDDEPDCKGYSVPFELIVNPPGTFTVRPLQELTTGGPAGSQMPKPTSEQRVRSIVRWTNQMILGSQPTYSSKGVIPHYKSMEERSKAFSEARFDAIWRKDPESYETLGNVYTDWGAGAKAVDAYIKELRIDPTKQDSPSFLTSLSEACRQKGRLEESERYLNRALEIDPENGLALNSLGNLYLDHANIARDRGDISEAWEMLEKAQKNYAGASRSDARWIQEGRSIALTNLGETYLARADVARQTGRIEEAVEQYRSAEKAFTSSQRSLPDYPFNFTGVGKTYNGLGELSQERGERSSATADFGRSEQNFKEAIRLNPDMSGAYIGLGNVYENLGRRQQAIASYKQATKARPEDPTPYYHLGQLLEQSDRLQAAQYFSAYLQLQRKDFLNGQRAIKAEKVVREVLPPPRPTEASVPVKVPGVKGKEREEAIRKIVEAGLTADVQEQQSCKDFGEVLSQDPKKNEKVSKGSRVMLSVAVPGEISVPRMEGQSREEARILLRQMGLDVELRTRQDERPEGTVIGQDPRPDARVAAGCKVKLTVAIPIRPVLIPVPKFIGHTEHEAKEALTGLRTFFTLLNLGEITYQESERQPGTVIDQYPKPGSMVPAGTAVNLVVAQPYEDYGVD